MVNPIAAISSVQLMFETIGARQDDEDAILCSEVRESAISAHLSSGGPVTYDLGGSSSTSEVGGGIASKCIEMLSKMSS